MFFPNFLLLTVSLLLFFFGIVGTFIIKRNLVIILVSIELILVSVQLNLLITSFNFNDIVGQVFILFILLIAASEVALGLALFIVYYRLRGTIDTKFIYLSKG